MELVSLKGMETFNEAVDTNVRNWNPWQLSKIYYGELLNGGIYSIPGVKLAHRIPPAFFAVTALNIVPASLTTVKRYVFDGGTSQRPAAALSTTTDWTRVEIPPAARSPTQERVGFITGLIGIALGVLAVLVFFKYGLQTQRGLGFWAALLLLSPLAGSVIVWLISLLMLAMTAAFGKFLHSVPTIMYLGTTVPLLAELGKAAVKPIEDKFVSPIIERATV